MGSTATTCHATTTPTYDLDSLQQQLEDMNVHARQATCPSSSDRVNTTRTRLDHFRITLYLSLIPQHLIPRHLFTIDPRTGFNLRKSMDRTVHFLHRLEELWDTADYCEEVVLQAIVRSVSGRQQQWGGESELTAGDLEKATEMVCRGATGAWSPVSETGSTTSNTKKL